MPESLAGSTLDTRVPCGEDPGRLGHFWGMPQMSASPLQVSWPPRSLFRGLQPPRSLVGSTLDAWVPF